MFDHIVSCTNLLSFFVLISEHEITAVLYEPNPTTLSNERKKLEKSLTNNEILPKVHWYLPKHIAEVTWDDGEIANLGNRIPKKKVLQKPKVRWPYDNDTYYSLLFTDIDDPQNTIRFDEYNLWFVYNILKNDIDNGTELLPYMAPEVKQFSHRVVITVFSHTKKILVNERNNMNYIKPERDEWSVMAVGYDLEGALHAANWIYVSPLVYNVHPRLRSSTTQGLANISHT